MINGSGMHVAPARRGGPWHGLGKSGSLLLFHLTGVLRKLPSDVLRQIAEHGHLPRQRGVDAAAVAAYCMQGFANHFVGARFSLVRARA